MGRDEILPGTLALLILRTLARGREMHGFEIARSIQQISQDVLQVEEGSLYPALQRMLVKGWVKAEWGATDENRRARVTPRTLLSDLIRGPFGLTATHVGCEHGVCGACNVLVDGTAIRSCLMLAVQADGRSVQTLEGLRDRPEVARLIDRFVAEHSLQCGFCTPGFIVTLAELRRNRTSVTPERLIGNICRCTGYAPILRASRGPHERA